MSGKRDGNAPTALASPLNGLPATAIASSAKATATYSRGLRSLLTTSVSVPAWERALALGWRLDWIYMEHKGIGTAAPNAAEFVY